MTEPHDDGGPIEAPPRMLSAPWTDTQVRAIQAWQAAGTVHPLTCATSEHGPLEVHADELWCRSCSYKQTWVPAVCAENFPSDFAPPLAVLAQQKIAARVAALVIAIRLMEMHLELATPGGAGRDSIAWTVAIGRVDVLREMLEELQALQPAQPSVD